jgi:hypothetical protein
MKIYCLSLLLALSSPLLVFADEANNRPDVEELLTVMRMEKTLQNTMDQVKKVVPQMTANMLKQQMPNTTQGAAAKASAMQQKIFALLQEEMSWAKMKGDYVKIYAESLTPDETKGIIAFYKSPAGQAYLDKQPIIMEKTMLRQQTMMAGLMPKMQALLKSDLEATVHEAGKPQPNK